MATKTTFLELTIPANGEFVDVWDAPLNANMEEIDDHLSALHDDLVGPTGDTANLKGSAADLGTRLDVGLEADGSAKISTNTQFSNLKTSAVRPESSKTDLGDKIRDRLDAGDIEASDLRFNTHADRYGGANPEAVTGASLLAAVGNDASVTTEQICRAPVRGFTPNSVVKGPGTAWTTTTPQIPTHLLSDEVTPTVSTTQAAINGSAATPVVYNINGSYFAVRETWVMDIPLSLSGQLWFFVSRAEADYNSASAKQWGYSTYKSSLTGSFMLNPRVLPTNASLRADADTATDPTDGAVTAASSTLTSAGASFVNFGVEAGDTVVISSPAALAGSYVVDSVTDANNLEISGEWTATATGMTFHIERKTIPSFGYVLNTPTYNEDRVYIGKATVTLGVLSDFVPFTYNGIYDTGWQTFLSRLSGGGSLEDHYLGNFPTQVDILVRNSEATQSVWINPTIPIAVQHVDETGGTTWGTELEVHVPAFKARMTYDDFVVTATNPLLTQDGVTQVFYDDDTSTYIGDSSGTYYIRVILRR